ncbi:MAG: hypothetical protein Q8N15_03385, partial [Bacillota bacterium]|nr:hypothetical protein [Bacillota bacterium]
DPLVHSLMADLRGWPGKVKSSHKSSSQVYHKLAFLSDIGLRSDDPGMPEIIAAILALRDDDGVLCIGQRQLETAGKTVASKNIWALCDAPVTMAAVAKMGLSEQPDFVRAATFLVNLGRDNGWPCRLSADAAPWRGPGRKQDPCPFATLAMLKLCAAVSALSQSVEAVAGAHALLDLWQNSRELHPYMFYMGTDFRKLKVPFVWYDILNVADTLSRDPSVRKDPRLQGMMDVIRAKALPDGTYAPESDWKPWADAGFAHKGNSSDWLTFLILRIEARLRA